MWVVAKIDIKKISTLKNEFFKKLGKNVLFYSPKLKLRKFMNSKIQVKENFILGNYILCFHKEFEKKSSLTSLKYCKGLKYFLNDLYSSQKEILDFISKCKKNEDKEGFIKQNFFDFEKLSFVLNILHLNPNDPFVDFFINPEELITDEIRSLLHHPGGGDAVDPAGRDARGALVARASGHRQVDRHRHHAGGVVDRCAGVRKGVA